MSAVNVVAFAEVEEPTAPVNLSISSVDAQPGSNVHLDMTFTGDCVASTITLFVYWDSTKLTYASDKLTKGPVWMDIIENDGIVVSDVTKPGRIGFTCIAPAKDFPCNGVLFGMDFVVSEDITEDESIPVTFEVTEFKIVPIGDQYGTSIEHTLTYGSVNVTVPPVEFAVSSAEATPGEDVTVAFTVNGKFEAHALTAHVYYDSTMLTPVEDNPIIGEVWQNMLDNGGTILAEDTLPGDISFMGLMPEKAFSQNGTIFTMKFHVSESVEPGTTIDLELSVDEFNYLPVTEVNPTPISRTTSNGSITVVEPLAMYTVQFVDWDGTVLSEQTVEEGSAATAPAVPERLGYTFTGWDNEFTNVTSNLVVTAQYSQNEYTITYNVNGEFFATQTYHYGDAVVAPEYSVPTGYTFGGWDVPETMPAENLVLDATLTINTFTVTFVDWNGDVIDTQTVAYGNGAVAPADPEREGYTFIGWDVEFNNITADLVVTAMYEKNIVIGDVDGDGVVTIADAMIIMHIGLGLITEQYDGADVNGDGIVDSTDALLAIRIALGILSL